MTKARLGRWTSKSGNACHATLELTPPSGLAVSFTWKSALTGEDQDGYICELLPDVLRRAVDEVDRLAQSMEACLELESKGILERVGVNDEGLTQWSLTEKGRTISTDSNENMLARFLSNVRGIRALEWLYGRRPNT